MFRVTKMLLTVPEAAEALNLSVHTLRRAVRDGLIPSVRPLGRRAVRVRVDDVLRLAQPAPSQGA
jgi:excisionase family DNA binding protein